MPEPVSTSVAKALERVVEDIHTTRDYYTDLGQNVYRGFYAHAVDGATFPVVAIQPESEVVESARTDKNKVSSTIRIVVVTNDTNYPADILRACVADIRRAFALNAEGELKSLGVNFDPEIGTAEFAIAADSPLTLAAMSVGFSFVENYEA